MSNKYGQRTPWGERLVMIGTFLVIIVTAVLMLADWLGVY